MKILRFAVLVAALFASCAHAQNAGTVANHAYVIGKGPGVTGYTSLLCSSGQLAIGSAADPVCQTITGDVTITPGGVTAIGAGKVTNTILASMAAHTYKGNNTAALAAPLDLTQTQLTAELNPCTATLKGLVPAPPNNTTTFLRGDCTFAASVVAGQFPGTATNDNANAGNIGEFISSSVLTGSSVPLTSGVTANLTSISLTAGDWDVSCQMYFLPAATTGVVFGVNSISTTSATGDFAPGNFGEQVYATAGTVIGANNFNVNAGPRRMSLAATTTVFATALASFNTSTMGVYGILRARRIR